MVTPTLPVTCTPGEIRQLLDVSAEQWDLHRPDDDSALDALLWLRAARGAWRLGVIDEARLWYGRVAEELLDVALGFGVKTGTYAYYAELALGCASLSANGLVLSRVGEMVRLHPTPPPSQRRRGRWVQTADPMAVAHEVLRAWAARLTGTPREAAAAALLASRLADTLPPHSEYRWQLSRWPDVLAALVALLDGRADALESALLSLDRKLAAEALRAPTLTAAVSETLASLAAEWKRSFPRSYAVTNSIFTLAIAPPT